MSYGKLGGKLSSRINLGELKMGIEVNGKEIKWVKDETVKELLKRVKYSFPLVVVKINDKVVPRSDFSKVTIPDNSKIAVVHMISGG